jgi:hypothetical protein
VREEEAMKKGVRSEGGWRKEEQRMRRVRAGERRVREE